MIDPSEIVIADDINDEQLQKDVLLLENDLEALGWDIPARLYAVMGTPGDYRLELITEMSGHPVDWMRMAVCGDENHPGGRLHDDVVGVACAVEGWRHPHAEDIKKNDPETWAMFMDLADRTGVTDPDEIVKHINNAMQQLHEQIPPSANPARIEIRSVMVLMRDGRGCGAQRDRNGEPSSFKVSKTGRLMVAMEAMLTGCWPADEEMNTPTPHRE